MVLPTEEELTRLAEAALLSEAKRAALRADIVGSVGWLKPKLPSTNKRFLKNTIKGVLLSNHLQDKKSEERKDRNQRRLEKKLKKLKKYKRSYLKASTKSNIKTVDLDDDDDDVDEVIEIKQEKSYSKNIEWDEDDGIKILPSFIKDEKMSKHFTEGSLKPSKSKKINNCSHSKDKLLPKPSKSSKHFTEGSVKSSNSKKINNSSHSKVKLLLKPSKLKRNSKDLYKEFDLGCVGQGQKNEAEKISLKNSKNVKKYEYVDSDINSPRWPKGIDLDRIEREDFIKFVSPSTGTSVVNNENQKGSSKSNNVLRFIKFVSADKKS